MALRTTCTWSGEIATRNNLMWYFVTDAVNTIDSFVVKMLTSAVRSTFLGIAMKKLVLAAALMGGMAAPAMAADVMETAPVASFYDWTGFYLGAHIGGGSSRIGWNYQIGADVSHRGNGVFGGAQVGYNVQSGNWVFGAEGDISAASIKGSRLCPNPTYSCQSNVRWLGSARLRAGYALDNILFYGTGGLGFGSTRIQTVHPTVGTNGTTKTKVGYTLGAGVEYAFNPNWTVKGEYMFYDLGKSTYTVDTGLLVNANTKIHTFKVGVNYKF